MQQKTVPWGEATMDELKTFATAVLGMTVNYNIGEDTLRAKIRPAFVGDSITIMVKVQEKPADAPAPAPEAPKVGNEAPKVGKPLRGSSAEKDPKVTITIVEGEGTGGKRPVPVGVNGVLMLIPRGKPVDIPYRYYAALQLAIKTVHEQDEATQEIISTDVPSYPFSVNRMPPQADIEAYLEADRTAA